MRITTDVASSNLAQAMCSRFNVIWYILSLTFAKSVAFSEYSVSSTNKTDRHDITEALLKVALSTITLTPFSIDLSVYLYIIILPLASGSLRSHGSTGSFGSHGNTGSVGSHKTSGFFGTHGATGSMGSHGTKTSSYGMFHKSIFLYQDNTYEMQKQNVFKTFTQKCTLF